MTPVRFPESNIVMTSPKGMENCIDVHACKTSYDDGQQVVITAWRPSNAELVKINLGEPIFLMVCGVTMPPVSLTADSPFIKPTED